jgi:type VI protein secretion system component VasF
MTEREEQTYLRLTEVCWPVLDYLINFTRRAKNHATPPPDQVRHELRSALLDAEDLARREAASERVWDDRLKAMMVYLIDYKMVNTEWDGRDFWFENRFETDPTTLDHGDALGGDKVLEDCDEIMKEYELAERRERRDRFELAELLSLFFICLRLGFRGKYHDRPQEWADYTRRLFTRLPAYATTKSKELFPEAYRHNQEVKVDYKLGLSLTLVLVILVAVLGISALAFRISWSRATDEIAKVADASKSWSAAATVTPTPGATTPAGPNSSH